VSFPNSFRADHNEVLNDSVVLGILVHRRADHDDAISGYTDLKKSLSELVEDIEKEIRL
jgi:hypothetical protein